jgi:hypothetical protein
MTLIFASQDISGSTAGTVFTSTLNNVTNTWSTAPVVLNGADADYVSQVYGGLGGMGSPELLPYNGFVFLQAAVGGLPNFFVYQLGSNPPASQLIDPRPSNDVALAPVGFTVFDNDVYFNGTDDSGTHWLYKIAPKNGGSIKTGASLASLVTTAFNGSGAPLNPTFMVKYGTALFMNAVGSNNQSDLISFNGTFQPAIEGENQNAQGSGQGSGFNPRGLAVGGSDLFFNGVDTNNNKALYVYNGTGNAQEAAIKHTGSSQSYDPFGIKGTVDPSGESVAFFSGVKDSAGNRTIFKTTVKAGGGFSTQPSENDSKGRAHNVHNLDPYNLTLIGTDLYFTGNDDNTGNNRGLFVLNTVLNTYREIISSSDYNFLYDNIYNSGWGDLNPRTLTTTDGKLYFGALKAGSSTPQLYEYTTSGAQPVTTDTPSPVGFGPASLTHS